MDENKPTLDEQLLVEARRTTHAVRAIARFTILQVTYSVTTALLGTLGAFALIYDVDSGGTVGVPLLVFAGLLAVVGLIHSISAGWSELGKSGPAAVAYGEPSLVSIDRRRILNDHACTCSAWERGSGNTAEHEGRTYCLRCFRYMPGS